MVGDVVQAVAQGLGQPQFEEAEHGQGEHHEKQRERYQHPGRLQARLQVQACAEQAHQCAEHREAGGHWQHVGQRQRQAAHATNLAAQHHTGKDR